MLHEQRHVFHFKINMEPIIILAFDEETERGIPVTNEDVERGSLEQGWVVITMQRWDAVTTDEIRTVRCAMGEHEVRRISDEGHHGWNVPPRLFEWTARIEGVRYAPASKVRLSADEIVFVTMCVADLRPGMVFTSAGTLCVNDSLFVCMPNQRGRLLGSDTEWAMSPPVWLPDSHVTVCCTRPSMQFILK